MSVHYADVEKCEEILNYFIGMTEHENFPKEHTLNVMSTEFLGTDLTVNDVEYLVDNGMEPEDIAFIFAYKG